MLLEKPRSRGEHVGPACFQGPPPAWSGRGARTLYAILGRRCVVSVTARSSRERCVSGRGEHPATATGHAKQPRTPDLGKRHRAAGIDTAITTPPALVGLISVDLPAACQWEGRFADRPGAKKPEAVDGGTFGSPLGANPFPGPLRGHPRLRRSDTMISENAIYDGKRSNRPLFGTSRLGSNPAEGSSGDQRECPITGRTPAAQQAPHACG